MEVRKINFDTMKYWEAVRLREVVLRLPLGMRFGAEELQKEKDELIICLFDDQRRIRATNQFILSDKRAKMRQVSTAMSCQGKGFGARLYSESEQLLKGEGIEEIYCHARCSAKDFYLKMGFEVYSEEFLEVGIPHIKMRKRID